MSDDWLQLQQKYWEQWADIGRKAVGDGFTGSNPWENAMDHWWQAVSPAAPDMSRGFVEKMMEQGKMFFRMAETFTSDLPTAGDDGWQGFNQILDEMQKAFTGEQDQEGEAIHKMMAFWELPYDNWQRVMSSISPVPGDLLRNMPHPQIKDNLNRILSAPGLGYTREEQTQYQELMRHGVDYQRAQQEYMGFFSHIGIKSTDRMRKTVTELYKDGKTIDSARNLYDTWVGCCEEVYAEEVRTTEYARIHGRLVNAQMALKKRMTVMVDETLGTMNMPTRRELRTLQDRLQETRREQKNLRRELDHMKAQMSASADRASKAPAATAATRQPATARKKTVARKKTAAKTSNK